jgi:outer membrane protein OmpA-like peptidoglycan-associated protein
MAFKPCTRLFVVLLAGVCILAACATAPTEPARTAVAPPQPFEPAIRSLTRILLDHARADLAAHTGAGALVAIEPFTDADSAEVPQVSRRIEAIMQSVAMQRYEGLRIERLTTDTLGVAAYLISGAIRLAPLEEGGGAEDRYYQVVSEIRNLKDIRVIGTGEAWISDRNLDFAPTALYRDSPFYFRDGDADPKAPVTRESLRTRALLTEAATAYEVSDYENALELFRQAEARPDGKSLRTYAGLYMANRKLGRTAEAETAFARIVELSVERYGRLTVKFLFDVNSADFAGNAEMQDQYDLWLRQIGRYFRNTEHCLRILGHCSRTGSAEFNDQLSLARAKNIQRLLKPSFPSVMARSEAVGMGFKENIVGIGTDDERDALDRRVEIDIVPCSAIH